ncbi:hypothetical protein DFQ29_006598 [Apophysomyces sp. BC1021]|nr:hypothetical protein DFQ29_006598 [Apophysomyces sp. BC1021]
MKVAFGCFNMIKAILEKYPYADHALLENVQVLFIHTSVKDHAVRLWIMKPAAGSKVLSFQRFEKIEVNEVRTDLTSLMHVINSFWVVKDQVEKATTTIEILRQFHENNFFELIGQNWMTKLADLLQPKPIKPCKKGTHSGVADMDLVSFLG